MAKIFPQNPRTLLKLLFSGLLITALLATSRMEGIGVALRRVPALSLLTVLIIQAAALAVNALKWRLLLPDRSFDSLFRLGLIGKFYSLLLPGQMTGELAKAYIAGQGRDDRPNIVVSVALDKATGLTALMALGWAGLFLARPAGIPTGLLHLFFGLSAAGLAAFTMVRTKWLNQQLVQRLEPRAHRPGLTGRIYGPLLKAILAWRSYVAQPMVLAKNFLLGLVFQLLSILIYTLIARAMGMHDVYFTDWCWVLGVVSVAAMVPFTLSGIGAREGSLVVTLGWLGIPREVAFALALIILGLQTAAALAGLVLEWRRIKKTVRY
ncbi:MAG: lysylphosphatidylglycerol synthase transmembrane domain-containing protein [Fibrobacterota bacterium]